MWHNVLQNMSKNTIIRLISSVFVHYVHATTVLSEKVIPIRTVWDVESGEEFSLRHVLAHFKQAFRNVGILGQDSLIWREVLKYREGGRYIHTHIQI